MNNETKSVSPAFRVRTISGFAGGHGRSSPAEVTLVVNGYSDTVEDIRLKVERAVNAHDDLLAACKAVRDNWESNLTEAMALVNAAIEKAGGLWRDRSHK